MKGTSTRTTSPGLRLLIEVGLIAKEVERWIVNEKGDLGDLSLSSSDKTNLDGILTRGDGFGELHVTRVCQSTVGS